jgi:hypothetical protein
MAPAPQPFAVRRLRVRDGQADAVAARLRTERALAAVELQPRGLPPAAILLVRSLRTTIAEAPTALDELLRVAARPAREAVPAQARAVLFGNRAELLACLAVDWCSGVASSRWWWSLVAPTTESRGPASVWADTPELVPAAFALLAARGHAVGFAARLDDAFADQLTEAVARVHGVPAGSVDANGRATVMGAEVVAADPAPEARAEELTQPQRRLLRLGLTLHRAPAALRIAAEPPIAPPRHATPLAHTAERARPVSNPVSKPTTGPDPVSAGAGKSAAQRRSPAGDRSRAPSRGDAQPAGQAGPAERVVPAAPPLSGDLPRLEPPLPARETAPSPAREPPLPIASAGAADDEPTATLPVTAAAPIEPLEPEREHVVWRLPVETRLGGLLFLLGVAQRLGLYADFTEPAGPGLALDPWRFLALVGARLLDVDMRSDSQLGEDAIWPLLEELARGEEKFPPEAELDAHAAAVRGWIEASVDLPLRDVLERPACIHADETRVDAVFSLAAHPIEIRLAGLDLDPGWIPAAGRALYFHFE